MRQVHAWPVERPYEVLVGPGAQARARAACWPAPPAAAVVHAPAAGRRGRRRRRTLQAAGVAADSSSPTARRPRPSRSPPALWEELGRLGFTRTDAVVGVGGGAVTDLAGFVAATWLRGVRVVQVPTSLLGMVDAAVGGKTGINTAAGKNLVGAFHPPAGVLADPTRWPRCPRPSSARAWPRWSSAASSPTPRSSTCSTPTRPAARDTDGADRARGPGQGRRGRARTCATPGVREILNYGHTLGHAIERVEDFRWRHGEAVAVGLVFAAELGRAGRPARPPPTSTGTAR